MKLRLPQSLFAIALTTLSFSQAATVGTGVSYDNGKGSAPYSADESAHNMGTYTEGEHAGQPRSDTVLCWANSAANMIQFWQDAYGEYVTKAAPNGLNKNLDGSLKYSQPDGTRYLNIYENMLTYSLEDSGGYQRQAIDWYFLNGWKDYLDKTLGDRAAEETYVQSVFDGAGHAYREDDISFSTDFSTLTQYLEEVFTSQGQAIGLQVWQQDADDILGNSRYHAITCWGFEKKGDVVSALYLTDSDDREFGVFKVDVIVGESLPFDWLESMPEIVLQTSDKIEGYGDSFVVGLMGLQSIATPDQYAKAAIDAPVPTLQGGEQTSVTQLKENTMVDNVTRIGAGVQVGDGSAIVMLVSADENSSLSMSANGAGGTGLDVEQGSLASLSNLSVSDYERGVNAEGKVYLYGRSIDVSGNELIDDSNGAGIRNTNYVEIKDCESVLISGNYTFDGRGGGIYNEDVVSISDNGAVIFEYNIAGGGGNDIYNAAGASLNIADNDSVLFSGMYYLSPAVVNDGNMYVKSTKDSNGIKFQDSALDSSKGVTYLGRDINGETSATTVAFTETDLAEELPTELARLEMTTGEDGLVTELNHLSVSAHEIMGVGADTSSLKNANVFATNDITLSDLKMDSRNHFTGSGTTLTLNNLVINLAGLELISNTFDISNMFDEFGGMMIDNVYLDASSLNLYERWDETSSVTVNFGDSLKSLDDGAKLTVLLGNNMMTSQWVYQAGGNVTFKGAAIIPEPATGALSLLALAGLAARRRRK